METLKEKYKHFVENININNNNNKRNNSPSNLEAIKPIIEREVYWKCDLGAENECIVAIGRHHGDSFLIDTT